MFEPTLKVRLVTNGFIVEMELEGAKREFIALTHAGVAAVVFEWAEAVLQARAVHAALESLA